jgi:hypothetical protein
MMNRVCQQIVPIILTQKQYDYWLRVTGEHNNVADIYPNFLWKIVTAKGITWSCYMLQYIFFSDSAI